MKIGIIGSGNIGGALGRLWCAAGHVVMFSSRNMERLAPLVAAAGPNASVGSVDDAIAFGDAILEAVPFAATLQLPPAPLAGKVLISASNYYPERDGDIDLAGRSQTELVAERLPQTLVVKAFNAMYATEMASRADGVVDAELAIFFAGDDDGSRTLTRQLIEDSNFAPADAGVLANGKVFESGGPLYGQRLDGATATRRLAEHRDT
ncbi:NADPH-dependent F420 reductase [Mycobacterium sp.]|uniref:NADPH-dependent F420 reductase n=1 Tax=Mycobacterium sp. TaxID=1785 RepID=UPI003D0C4173